MTETVESHRSTPVIKHVTSAVTGLLVKAGSEACGEVKILPGEGIASRVMLR